MTVARHGWLSHLVLVIQLHFQELQQCWNTSESQQRDQELIHYLDAKIKSS